MPLANLLTAVGGTLRPKVFCVQELAHQGAGHPDFGLYTTQQVQKGKPKSGQKPERGVVEVKPVADDAWLTASGDQVSRYWDGYRRVLVTNARDFVLIGEDASGQPVRLETFRTAASDTEFNARLERPRAFAREVGAGLGEYLGRVLSHSASAVRAQGCGLAVGILRPGRPGKSRSGQRYDVPRYGTHRAGRIPGRTLRGRRWRRLFPFPP